MLIRIENQRNRKQTFFASSKSYVRRAKLSGVTVTPKLFSSAYVYMSSWIRANYKHETMAHYCLKKNQSIIPYLSIDEKWEKAN